MLQDTIKAPVPQASADQSSVTVPADTALDPQRVECLGAGCWVAKSEALDLNGDFVLLCGVLVVV